jgi:hypothetical protein
MSVIKYIGSQIAKRVLKIDLISHKKFDKIMKEDVDVTMSNESAVSQALRILRSDKIDKKSIGGEIIKGGDYIKDLL